MLLFIFILVNAFVIMHAYKFTHFQNTGGKPNKKPSEMSQAERVQTLITGVSLARPMKIAEPDFYYKQVKIESNAVLDAWHSKVNNAKGTVLLCHGYGGEKSTLNNYAKMFKYMGYNTLQVDFMGAGASSDSVVTIGYKEAVNVKDAFNYLQSQGEQNIIGFGVSMGSVSLLKAYQDYKLPFKSMILECPFGSMLETVKARFDLVGVTPFPLAHLLTFWGGAINGFNAFSLNPVDYAKSVDIPVLLMSGDKDEYVSLDEIDAIYNNLQGEKQKHIIHNAQHENYVSGFQNEWLAQVRKFLKTHK